MDNNFYGRDREMEFLLKSIADFESSDTSLLLVEGSAGIGKTTLIQQVLSDYKKQKCFKLYGKYSNQPGQIPYQAMKEVMKGWMNQILVLSEEELNQLKENAVSALQNNIGTITSVFDELQPFFGRKQFNIIPSDKAEAHQIKSKFYYFFTKFLKSVTRTGYQIILFLDDLQWADNASWALIQELITRNAVPDLIIIGAYRPIEGDSDLQSKINNLKKLNQGKTLSYSVDPLESQYFKLLIPDQWHFSQQDSDAFNKYLEYESEGNPFNVKEIIKAIEKEQLIKTKTDHDSYFWENLPRFDRAKSSVNFIQEQLKMLPPHQMHLISAASCIGFNFKADLLKQIVRLSSEEIDRILLRMTNDELLIKKDSTYIFVHDTIFSAANALLTVNQKFVLHQKIGRIILSGLENYHQNEFFQAISHLNTGLDMEKSKCGFTPEYILLNIQAARLAIKKSAFDRAWKYFSFADQLLKYYRPSEIIIKDLKLVDLFENQKLNSDDLGYFIQFGYAETMFLMQKFDRALFYSNEVLKLKINRHQKILATLIKIRICSALIYKKDVQEILGDGLNSLESVLHDFDITFPDRPDELLQQAAADSFEINQLASGISEDTNFQALINPEQEYQDLMKLVINSMTFVYYMDVRKNLFIGIKFLLLSFTQGFTPMTPVLFSVSFISASISNTYLSMAFLLGKISLRMIEKPPFSSYAHIIYYVATLNFFAWENHYKICVKKLKESVQLAREAGDHHYASFCATNVRLLNIYRGKNLKKHILYSQKLESQNQHIFFISSSDSDLSAYLVGIKPGFLESKFDFSTDLIKEAEYNLSGRYHLNLALQKLYYLSGNYSKALDAGNACENIENVYRGFQIKLEHFLFFSLSLLQSAYKNPLLLRGVLEKVNPKLEEFRRLSAFGSGNYLHKALLIEAEIAKCKGEFESATWLYDQAIQEAKTQKFIHHAAIAAELAGEYYLSKNRHRLATIYLKDALKSYSKWGADAKVEWMKQKYSFIIKDKTSVKPSTLPDYQEIRNVINKTALSQKMNLAKLGELLLSNLVEQSKARLGVILIQQNNTWQVLLTNKPELSGLENMPLNEIENQLPGKVLNFAINKAEKLILKDVKNMAHFADDPYFIQSNPANAFCYPILSGLGIDGLIYLEDINIDITERDDLFSVLIEHASIALSNALYNENLYRLNQELQVQEQKKMEAVIESQEKERKRIAEELHDSVGQMLALVKLNLSGIEATEELSNHGNNQLIQQTSQLLDESIDEVRTISHNLMPPDLKNKTLTEIAENLLKRNGLAYQFQTYGLADNLSEAIKFTLYRVIQEIIHNIIKHASAKKIDMSITRTDDGINLMVEDDGIGFNTSLVNSGLGLKNIHSRVKLLNGYFDVDSSMNRGTIYNITIPLNA
jgi:signal transduction histidine kinase/predicted ATPase